jgi:hypothetical protein
MGFIHFECPSRILPTHQAEDFKVRTGVTKLNQRDPLDVMILLSLGKVFPPPNELAYRIPYRPPSTSHPIHDFLHSTTSIR